MVQEILAEIGKRGSPPNLVIKLDMMKAYDRVEWLYLTKVLRKMGFGERLIDIVYRLVSNNWYSILLNEQPRGFFRSTKGIKQGDPSSPILFILAAEVMSRALNSLLKKKEFKMFGMPRGSPKINHLAFADDMIILCKAELGTMKLITEVLEQYENMSGEKINKEKNVIYLHKNVSQGDVIVAEITTGILRKQFPFIYLRCPIFHLRKQQGYYKQMVQKVSSKLQAWKGKLLLYGGTVVLIKHVLQSIPIHCLSVMNPPLNVLSTIHKMMAQFFWSSCIGGKGRHWTRWANLCLPVEEGGLGLRMLQDVSMALFCKLWWNFRTQESMWSEFMRNKYCKKEHPNLIMWKTGYGGTQVWEKMLQARNQVEHQIWWQTKNGTVSLWHDNWTGIGDLYTICGQRYEWDTNQQLIQEVVRHGEWDV